MSQTPFWKTTPLDKMTQAQWDSLCDGCGKCCLGMVDNPDKNSDRKLRHTNVACRLLDPHSCQCSSYPDRHRFVPDCIRLTPNKVKSLDWLPPSCAYRRLSEGHGLADWHHLVSGDRDSVHCAGMSVRGRTVSERDVDEYDAHIVDWLE